MSWKTSDLLERSRQELLDLSTRNRLLSIRINSKSARIIQVHDELSEQVFRILVAEKKAFSFFPAQKTKQGAATTNTNGQAPNGTNEEEVSLPQPDDVEDPATGLAKRHVDSRLQTALTSEALQRRLLAFYRDARTMIEEQGVNILYLVLGHLKWFEAERPDTPRYAPLILVPVELHRQTASERFYLSWLEEDLQENLSLAAKLKADFETELPPFPDDDDFSPTDYFNAVAKTFAGAKGWEVLPNAITLGFFSFAKFLMYRDLDPDNWPDREDLLEHAFITGLLQDGFPNAEPVLSDSVHIDELVPAARLDHVVDADSSQTLAIESARQGHSLVIQGPPGTGKSQSITNIISTAVLDGKKVLFVAEKLAALEVVKRRLEKEGLGPLCLELHSNKCKKRMVIEEIGRTWKLGRPKPMNDLLAKGRSFAAAVTEANVLAAELSNVQSDRLSNSLNTIRSLTKSISELREASIVLASALLQPPPQTFAEVDQQCLIAIFIALAPPVDKEALCNEIWDGELSRIEELLAKGREFTTVFNEAGERVSKTAWHGDFSKDREHIAVRGGSWFRFLSGNYRHAIAQLRGALTGQFPEILADRLALIDQIIRGQQAFRVLCERDTLGQSAFGTLWRKERTDWSQVSDVLAWIRRQQKEGLQTTFRQLFALIQDKPRIGQILEQVSPKLTKAREAARQLPNELGLDCQAVYGVCNMDDVSFDGIHQQLLKFDNLSRRHDAIQCAARVIRENDSLGRQAFGTYWRQERTNWDQVGAILIWLDCVRVAGLDYGFRILFSRIKDPNHVAQLLEKESAQSMVLHKELEQLFQELKLDCITAFEEADLNNIRFGVLIDLWSVWLSQMEGLSRWNNYLVRSRKARELGLSALVEQLETGAVSPKATFDCFDRIYYSQLLRHVIKQKPELARFDGAIHNTHVEEFRQLDQERLALAKYRTLVCQFDGMPPTNSAVGPAGIVRGEMERKRGHRTVRRLLKDAGSVVQAIKPVFMMSPLSIAQFLEPGAVEFDLLVIDEASQVQPVDALGAIARCKQIVVVGDSKQLPPTRFFTRLTTESDEPEDEEEEAPQTAEARDIESILGLCSARGLPQTMLQWHYRSRHHSLIAISNREFYESRLFIVPSPYINAADHGLKFHNIPEGVFDAGGSGTNRVEAKAICRAIIEHARKSPALSLGVAAFSVRQQQAILDELEFLRRENADTEAFFSGNVTEPFFVKNLENVQGDERDVIFISVGYGRDANGNMAMRFGPLSNEGGERRLNVLISRAKKRCEVFSSITGDDIDLGRTSSRGVAAFKAFLSFAQTGRLGIAELLGREEQSPFEEAVRHGVESLGYEVHPQVGVTGFFIDLAVLDREHPGHYLLGIECDGAQYHSSCCARDRDRLRQAILENHGWIIHRIWSTDWFQRPTEQLRKVANALERAKVIANEIARQEIAQLNLTLADDSEDDIQRETGLEADDDGINALATPYREARFEVPSGVDPHKLPRKDMAEILLRIVREEGPIHEDELVTRVRDLWGLGRAGNRIQDAVANGVRFLLVSQQCTREDGFLSITNTSVPVRNREKVSSSNLRKPEFLPLSEIRAAILVIIDTHHGATAAEIPVAVARVLGFKNTSGHLRRLIENQTAKLKGLGTITETSGMVKRVESCA